MTSRLTESEDLVVENATLDDLGELQMLLARSVPDCASETVWDLPFHWTSYRVVRMESVAIVAAASMRELSKYRSEIRGLVVKPDFRGEGLGHILIRHLLEEAESQGREAVCVTRKPSYFARHGFRRTHPTWISRLRHLAKSSIDSNPRVFMVACDQECK